MKKITDGSSLKSIDSKAYENTIDSNRKDWIQNGDDDPNEDANRCHSTIETDIAIRTPHIRRVTCYQADDDVSRSIKRHNSSRSIFGSFFVRELSLSRSSSPKQALKVGDNFSDQYAALEDQEKLLCKELQDIEKECPYLSTKQPLQTANPTNVDTLKTTLMRQDARMINTDLFEIFLILGPDTRDYYLGPDLFVTKTLAQMAPQINYIFPPESVCDVEWIEHFCFPLGVPVQNTGSCPTTQESSKHGLFDYTFSVLVISGSGKSGQGVKYAFCMYKWISLECPRNEDIPTNSVKDAVPRPSFPICYCFISSHAFPQTFYRFLRSLLEQQPKIIVEDGNSEAISFLTNNQLLSLETNLINYLNAPTDSPIHGALANSTDPFMSAQYDADIAVDDVMDKERILILRWSLPRLFLCLSINNILKVLQCLMAENKVIVVCSDLELLSPTVLALANLLAPFKWVGPLVTVLPRVLHGYLDAPVPYLLGTLDLPKTFSTSDSTVIVYPATGSVFLCEGCCPDDSFITRSTDILRLVEIHEKIKNHATNSDNKSFYWCEDTHDVDIAIYLIRKFIMDTKAETEYAVRGDNLSDGGSKNANRITLLRNISQAQMFQCFPWRPSDMANKEEKSPNLVEPDRVVVTEYIVNEANTHEEKNGCISEDLRNDIFALLTIAITGYIPKDLKNDCCSLMMGDVIKEERTRSLLPKTCRVTSSKHLTQAKNQRIKRQVLSKPRNHSVCGLEETEKDTHQRTTSSQLATKPFLKPQKSEGIGRVVGSIQIEDISITQETDGGAAVFPCDIQNKSGINPSSGCSTTSARDIICSQKKSHAVIKKKKKQGKHGICIGTRERTDSQNQKVDPLAKIDERPYDDTESSPDKFLVETTSKFPPNGSPLPLAVLVRLVVSARKIQRVWRARRLLNDSNFSATTSKQSEVMVVTIKTEEETSRKKTCDPNLEISNIRSLPKKHFGAADFAMQ